MHPNPSPRANATREMRTTTFLVDQRKTNSPGMGQAQSFTTALRPQTCHRPTTRRMNVLPAIGVYAAIHREKAANIQRYRRPSFAWEGSRADLAARRDGLGGGIAPSGHTRP